MSLVFLYGTLKRGHANHRLIDSMGGVFVCEAKAENYGLVNVYHICPGMVRQRNMAVEGELFSIRSRYFPDLDYFETNMYERREVQVTKPGGNKVWANAYIFKGRIPPNTPIFPKWEGK